MKEVSIEKLAKQLKLVSIETKQKHLFLSVSNGKERAKVKNVRGETLDDCLDWLNQKLVKADAAHIRVDAVTHIEEYSYADLMKRLSLVQRNNYFRTGIAFDRKFRTAFLGEEIVGSALIRPSKNHKVGFNNPELSINMPNLESYVQRKYNAPLKDKLKQKTFYLFTTQGFYFEAGEWIKLSTKRDQEGIRETNFGLLPKQIDHAIEYGEDFLYRQIKDSGQFIYGYYPTYDYEITGYNSVRHFSSVYALLEAQEYLGKTEELKRSEQTLDWGVKHLLMEKDGAQYVQEEMRSGISIKLGAQALAILAMAKFQTITGNDKYQSIINQLIQGIDDQFVNEEGETTHILDEQLETKKKFNIIYYDGEAVFSILRGYAITKDERHLQLAKKLFDRFVEKKYERYHDHWLSYATNEILLYLNDKKYYEFGLKNAFENMNFIEFRDTAYPTLLELLMAAIKMTDKVKETSYFKQGEFTQFVSKIDFWRLRQVAVKRAEIEIEKGVMFPEMAMFMKRPERIVHGFYTRHDKFRMRIDDQEHFLSGLINFFDYFYK
ncbi:hypothetical protein P7D85_09760 [Enterococcus hulanensis]|uniref:Poly(Glycerol-phosphate) alpha-glucosyltransferase n=1 Tax=Enterococcus hulanensis TaxID=2559929 RepID=A0ABU3F1N0_9ENTE|nr:hypothetical protein [Enterococcus hulanensis]MDT2600061.1 hypothetical protein [Enterococcus hulanensis]MDT2612026.1 hypothetical protein [Enterococcus hulanensis]MDT2619175.1 hypothetical protein [Enterococcus hulanensis]MDT2630736.1 hypothetical protein [Enterococcus hulanensis]MDT2658139.1 hypothetical protein [Enterococcus hulanensis]